MLCLLTFYMLSMRALHFMLPVLWFDYMRIIKYTLKKAAEAALKINLSVYNLTQSKYMG